MTRLESDLDDLYGSVMLPNDRSGGALLCYALLPHNLAQACKLLGYNPIPADFGLDFDFGKPQSVCRVYSLFRHKAELDEPLAVMTWKIVAAENAGKFLIPENDGLRVGDFSAITDDKPDYVVQAGLTKAFVRRVSRVTGPARVYDCRFAYGRWVKAAGGPQLFRNALDVISKHVPVESSCWFQAGAQGLFPVNQLGEWMNYLKNLPNGSLVKWSQVNNVAGEEMSIEMVGKPRPQSSGTQRKYEKIGAQYAKKTKFVNESLGPVWASRLR